MLICNKKLFSVFILILSINSHAQVCEKIINDFKSRLETTKKYCASDKHADFTHVKQNEETEYPYSDKAPIDPKNRAKRPAAGMFSAISACEEKSKICNERCGVESQNNIKLCTSKYIEAPLSKLDKNSALASIEMQLTNIDLAIACLNTATKPCADSMKEATVPCMRSEEGAFRSYTICEEVYTNLILHINKTNCDSTIAAEVTAFNEAKTNMITQLREFQNIDVKKSLSRHEEAKFLNPECMKKSEDLVKLKSDSSELLHRAAIELRKAREQLKAN